MYVIGIFFTYKMYVSNFVSEMYALLEYFVVNNCYMNFCLFL